MESGGNRKRGSNKGRTTLAVGRRKLRFPFLILIVILLLSALGVGIWFLWKTIPVDSATLALALPFFCF